MIITIRVDTAIPAIGARAGTITTITLGGSIRSIGGKTIPTNRSRKFNPDANAPSADVDLATLSMPFSKRSILTAETTIGIPEEQHVTTKTKITRQTITKPAPRVAAGCNERNIMRKTFLTLAVLIPALTFAQILASADYADPVYSADRHLPFGVRSAGMGNVGVAMSEDFTALFYNPANLAYIYRFELSGALHFDYLSYHSDFEGNVREGSDSYLKLHNIGVVIPVPTTRGGLTFGLGFTRTNTFDRQIRFSGTGADGLIYNAQESVKGGLGKFSIGGGVQVSPIAALGMSLDLYVGGERYGWFLDIQNPGGTPWPDTVERKIYEDDIRSEYSGVGGRFSMTLAPTKYVQLATYIATPTLIDIDEDAFQRFDSLTTGWEYYEDSWSYYSTVRIILPWKFGGGIAIRPTDWILLAADAEFVDWRQIEYDNPPELLSQNRLMENSYTTTLRWGAGAEFTIPVAALKLRGGFAQEPIAYTAAGEDRVRNTFTGGFGVLLGELMTLDAAVQISNWNVEGNRLDEEYDVARISLGLSHRF